MSFALCHLSVVPLRNNASDRSEQVSQLLFGEIAELLEWKGKAWVKVRCTWDNCIGWAHSSQLKPITNREFSLFKEKYALCLDLFQPILSENFSMPVTLGARLPDFDGMKFTFDGQTYFYSGQAVFPENLEPQADKLMKIARRFVYSPFQWGGRSPLGIDATGFTQVVFQLAGIYLPREAAQQVEQGDAVDFIEQSLPGDLAFFDNQQGNISHVGIILPENQIIHVSECVRIDFLDHFGIYNRDLNSYTHKLRVIKRILPPTKLPLSGKRDDLITASNQVALFE